MTNQLVIANISRHDLHSIFTCQASNNNVSVPVSTSVKLDVTCNALHCLSKQSLDYNVFTLHCSQLRVFIFMLIYNLEKMFQPLPSSGPKS